MGGAVHVTNECGQIGDLLASISGDSSRPSSTPPLPRVNSNLKRKADEELRPTVSKTPRTTPVASGGSATSTRPLTDKAPPTPYKGTAGNRPTAVSKPTHSSAVKAGSAPARSSNGASAAKLPASRPTPAAAAPAVKAAPPKKGSFAEIMARAQKAQSTMGQVGKIQHKVTERGVGRKEREEPAKDAKQPLARTSSKFKGSARPANGPSRPTNGSARPTNGTSRPGGLPLQRNTATKDPRNGASGRGKDKRAPPVEEKKIKKAAIATTGYTGTARPRPGTTSKAKPAAPGGALLNPRTAPRYGGSSKRSRYDEDEDEEMDDFIDYDDEEEDDMGGPRYRYDSGSESDMEAGMDDIYDEEAAAERAARREDIEQERLEKRLKAEKEERKRKFLEQQRNRR
ncbi:spt2 chromatin protein [Verticillium dahliae]